eukprot:CAMPEP_0179210432 /NCGR_PEP_ID=MMETSP0796-20121207/104954_1 /TAXON_ID=73915 /ORGANISM="Pyrodinium bahamense, Strain pbaha01" /LENGTH=216 /DNA_ID=CAMNT_0020915397 /DNA_START=461 /DNA_END=1111 /DNA_ORIENTATION=+
MGHQGGAASLARRGTPSADTPAPGGAGRRSRSAACSKATATAPAVPKPAPSSRPGSGGSKARVGAAMAAVPPPGERRAADGGCAAAAGHCRLWRLQATRRGPGPWAPTRHAGGMRSLPLWNRGSGRVQPSRGEQPARRPVQARGYAREAQQLEGGTAGVQFQLRAAVLELLLELPQCPDIFAPVVAHLARRWAPQKAAHASDFVPQGNPAPLAHCT